VVAEEAHSRSYSRPAGLVENHIAEVECHKDSVEVECRKAPVEVECRKAPVEVESHMDFVERRIPSMVPGRHCPAALVSADLDLDPKPFRSSPLL
jgi:hypothetical protein